MRITPASANAAASRPGDGGFDVKVKGKTDLVSGAITSTQKAVDEGKNSFDTQSLTIRDIQNRDNFSVSGFSLSGGYSTGGTGKPGEDGKPAPNLAGGVNGAAAGIASASGKNSSTTTSGVSGIAGDKDVWTGDGSGGLAKTFDADKVNQEVGAQLQITSTFGQQAASAGGAYADGKVAELRAQGNEAEAAKWDEGGANRVAMHTVLAGLTGGVQGALGAASSQLTIDAIGKQVAATDLPLGLKTALVAAAETAVGAATGGGAGTATGFNATANNYLTSTDLRNREQKIKGCQANGDTACEVRVLREYDLKSASNTGELQRSTLVERVSLEQTRTDLKNLLQDTAVSDATKAQARVSIQEINTAINVIDKVPVLNDAFAAGLLMPNVVMLGELAVSQALTTKVVNDFIAARTKAEATDEIATKIANDFIVKA